MRQKGFTLIESLVALVILSTVFAVTWQWFGVAAIATTKIERTLLLPDAFDALAAHLKDQGLRESRSGTFVYKGLTLSWKADVKRTSTEEYLRRQPAWIVTLFDIQVEVLTPDGSILNRFNFDLLQQWRDPNYIDDGLIGIDE